MCGICGYISRERIDDKILESMSQQIKNRGPDDAGILQIRSGGLFIGLAHRRLAIIDLSSAGHQPMYSKDKSITIVFNGEIYNFKDIRDQLRLKGHTFLSNTDTEVIIESYLEWGEDCFKYFNGMFSMALFDLNKRVLYMVRDRIGQKPLYYYYDGSEFVFASELKPIMEYPKFSKKIKSSVLAEYLYNGYISAPNTIFEDTYKLLPGHYLKIIDGKFSIHRYWQALDYYKSNKDQYKDYAKAKKQLKELIIDAVEKCLFADVPIGTFLSGGIDSTLITAVAQSIKRESVKTYTIGFDNPKYDEAIHAKRIATYLKTDHHELYVNGDLFLEALDSISQYFDEPFADSSQIPTMLVSQFARNDVTVVLTGDAGDELFCGYTTYDKLAAMQKLDLVASIANGVLRNRWMGKLALDRYLPSKVLVNMDNALNKYTKCQIINRKYLEKITRLLINNNQKCVGYSKENEINEANWQIRRMLIDMITSLPDDMLVKVDRSSMRYGLEARAPLLDNRIVELALSLSHDFKYKNGEKKIILKDILYDYVPKELMERPKKGFSIPIGYYVKKTQQELLNKLKNRDYIISQGIFDADRSVSLVNDFLGEATGMDSLMWKYIMFQLWYEKYM